MTTEDDHGTGGSGLGYAFRDRFAFASVATFFYWVAHQGIRPVIPIRVEDLGGSPLIVGLVLSVPAALALVIALPVASGIDRLGTYRVLNAACVCLAVLGFAYAYSSSIAHLAVVELVNGTVTLIVWIALQSMATDKQGDPVARRAMLSLFSLAWGVGIAIGPVAGTAVMEKWDFPTLGFAYSGMSVLLFLSVRATPRTPVSRPSKGIAVSDDGRVSILRGGLGIARRPMVSLVLFASFINLVIQSTRTSFYPLFLQESDVSLTEIGILLGVIGFSSVGMRVFLGVAMRRLGQLPVLVVSTWIGVAGLTFTPLLVGFRPLLYGGAILMGTALAFNPPITVELMATNTGEDERNRGMGLRLMANRLAHVTQPTLFGFVAGLLSLSWGFWVTGGLLTAMCLFMLLMGHNVGKVEDPP